MKNNEYLDLVEASKCSQSKLNFEQFKRIRNLYKDVAADLKVKSIRAKKGSLTNRWTNDYRKAILDDMKSLNKILGNEIQGNIIKSGENASHIQLNLFDKLNMKYGLNMDKTFKSMFSSIPKETLQELITGGFYKDGKGLSKRIWGNEKKVNGDIDYIIQKGLLEKKSAYELAQDLQVYVNPEAKQDFEWKKVYPGANKTIDYNAQRLARTSISHAYTLSMLKSCERNPFIEKIRWHSVFSPGRTCPLCKERNGKVFLLKNCPMDHPNGMCWQEPLIEDLENIGSRLNKWVNGENDGVLDNWHRQYGDYFNNTNKKHNLGDINQAFKRDKKVSITDIAINKVPYIEIPGFLKEENLILQQKHKELLNIAKNKNNSNEVLNILDSAFKMEVITLGNETGVYPNQNQKAITFMSMAKENSVIWIHNHPKSSTFSLGDWWSFVKDTRIKAMTVVTNKGNVFALHKNKKFDFKVFYDKIISIRNKYDIDTIDNKMNDKIMKELLEFSIKNGLDYLKR